jgi:phage FluMu protein Com
MAIEFRCTGCQKLLRTADETAGKQAKCPQCGTIVPIPTPSSAAAEPPPTVPPEVAGTWADPSSWQSPPVQNPPFAPKPGSGWGQGAGSFAGGANPYQSPAMPAASTTSAPRVGRHGPAWERNGPSPGSYVETFQECFTDIPEFFATMRRDGGFGAPLGFAFIGILVATAANVVYQSLNLGIDRFGANNNAGDNIFDSVAGMACLAVGMPIIGIVGLFLMAGVYHLFLMMLGGANSTYEATFRVAAYTTGITNLLQIIPCVGPQIGGLAAIVLLIIGLANIHETSGWKASGAVLIPVLLCCCAVAGLVSFAVYVAVKQQAFI